MAGCLGRSTSNIQTPNTKLQTSEKFQITSSKSATSRAELGFGAWGIFGVWSLVFGVFMLVWLNLHVRRKGTHAVRRGISLSLGVVIVLTLSAAAWFWRQKIGDVNVAGEKSPRSIAGTSTTPSGSSSAQKALTSAPVPDSAGRASRAPAVIIPAPSEIAPGTNAAGFLARVPQNVFETQLALARQGISPGSLDGVFGSKT